MFKMEEKARAVASRAPEVRRLKLVSMPNGSGGAGVPMGPPGLGGQDQQGLQASPEVLKSAELPLLPQPGGEQSAGHFGDWLTLVAPLVEDISNSVREWWGEVLNETTALYDRWLTVRLWKGFDSELLRL